MGVLSIWIVYSYANDCQVWFMGHESLDLKWTVQRIHASCIPDRQLDRSDRLFGSHGPFTLTEDRPI